MKNKNCSQILIMIYLCYLIQACSMGTDSYQSIDRVRSTTPQKNSEEESVSKTSSNNGNARSEDDDESEQDSQIQNDDDHKREIEQDDEGFQDNPDLDQESLDKESDEGRDNEQMQEDEEIDKPEDEAETDAKTKVVQPTPPVETPLTPKPKQLSLRENLKIPESCGGEIKSSSNDMVVHAGLDFNLGGGTAKFPSGWIADNAWNNGKLGKEKINGLSALTYGNQKIYHGFQVSAKKGNSRRAFSISGAVVVAQQNKQDGSKWGLRFIKPGEDSGNGGASTTTWLGSVNSKNERMLDLNKTCKAFNLKLPSKANSNTVFDWVVWEMQKNWNSNDKVYITHIVFQDFKWK